VTYAHVQTARKTRPARAKRVTVNWLALAGIAFSAGVWAGVIGLARDLF